jgi:hypothetical protein
MGKKHRVGIQRNPMLGFPSFGSVYTQYNSSCAVGPTRVGVSGCEGTQRHNMSFLYNEVLEVAVG